MVWEIQYTFACYASIFASFFPTESRAVSSHGSPFYDLSHDIIMTALILQVRDAAPMVDTRAPQTYMHLHLKLKKLQVRLKS